jgi:hypothetical protein
MNGKRLYAIVVTSLILVQSCTFEKKESGGLTDTVTAAEAEKHEHEMDVTRTEAGKPEFTVNEVFQKQVKEVFGSYVQMKNAFVDSDAEKVIEKAKETQKSLQQVDMKLVSGQAHNDWMVYQKELADALNNISSSSDIEVQREHFSKLSYSLYKTIKAYGLGGEAVYYDFCPMAFDNKGAYWLSDEEQIRNPYFGDKMLTCGSVEETLR